MSNTSLIIHIKLFVCFLLLLLSKQTNAQTVWISPKYHYSIEIPKGFVKENPSVGQNVDFKAAFDRINTIVIVVKKIPDDAFRYSLWDIYGDLNIYFNNLEVEGIQRYGYYKIIDYGKFVVSGSDALWYDVEREMGFVRYCQTKKGNYIYTFTLAYFNGETKFWDTVWIRFLKQIKF